MKLKQPSIPGVWGSWDPVTGSEAVPDSEWPEFNPADVPLDQPSSTTATAVDDSGAQHGFPSGSTDKQAGLGFGVLPRESHNENKSNIDKGSRSVTEMNLSHEKSETQINHTREAPLSGTVTATSEAAVAVSYLPSQTFFPVPLTTSSSPHVDETLQYTAPKPLPRPVNPTLDIDKDLAVKSAMVEARKTYGNGPMWGVAAPPPMSFSGTEDYEKIVSGATYALPEEANAEIQQKTSECNDETAVSRAEAEKAGALKEGAKNHDQESQQKPQGKKGLHSWVGPGSWWNTKW